MALQSNNKVNPNFNMSSLTDIIFLLLIFFMLTSNFVTPNGLDLILPSSNSTAIAAEDPIAVSVNKNKEYRVNNKLVGIDQMESVLSDLVKGKTDPTIVLYADKNETLETAVTIMNIAKALKVKMILATSPMEDK